MLPEVVVDEPEPRPHRLGVLLPEAFASGPYLAGDGVSEAPELLRYGLEGECGVRSRGTATGHGFE